MTPLIDITTDGHVHTRLCNHATGEMEEYVEQAIKNGLRTITFLEHLETDIRYQRCVWLNEKEFDVYFAEGSRLRHRYGAVIDIRLGVEAGYNPLATGAIRNRLAQYSWDRIGLSCHFFRLGGEDFNLLSRNQESLARLAVIGVERVVTAYFNALIEATGQIDCDVLCHLDAVLRHYPGIQFNDSHRNQIEVLLDCLKEKNIALEINTSGIDYRGTVFPAPWIIASAMQRGLVLSAGSDAHEPGQVGRHFAMLPAYLEEIRTSIGNTSTPG